MRPDGRCNSVGNPLHYLGFSFAGGNGLRVEEVEHDPALPWMHDGNWRVGVFMDAAASKPQAEKLGAVFSGQMGGPMAGLAPLIGEMLGVERARITYDEDGRGHHVRIGDAVDVGVQDFVALEGHDPVQLTNVFHPSNTTLTVAPANAAHLSTFGIDWGREGQSGFSAPFSWSG